MVKFADIEKPSFDFSGDSKAVRAISIAVAGKLNILAYGSPGDGKTVLLQQFIPYLTPCLTNEELQPVKRLYELAGMEYGTNNAPFRMPPTTTSIEGMCGGSPNLRPGEISLAHNGTLFLDEAAEFRTSILQMIRVPLETKSISLARAGRHTVFPANFQFAMAAGTCPCGNFLRKDRVCLCSARAIAKYWKKFSAPLLSRIQIRIHITKDENDTETVSPEELRKQVETACKIQRENGTYNKDLPFYLLDKYASENSFLKSITNNESRKYYNTLKTAITIANMDGRKDIIKQDWEEASDLTSDILFPSEIFRTN